jgi:hypothetical protein
MVHRILREKNNCFAIPDKYTRLLTRTFVILEDFRWAGLKNFKELNHCQLAVISASLNGKNLHRII